MILRGRRTIHRRSGLADAPRAARIANSAKTRVQRDSNQGTCHLTQTVPLGNQGMGIQRLISPRTLTAPNQRNHQTTLRVNQMLPCHQQKLLQPKLVRPILIRVWLPLLAVGHEAGPKARSPVPNQSLCLTCQLLLEHQLLQGRRNNHWQALLELLMM